MDRYLYRASQPSQRDFVVATTNCLNLPAPFMPPLFVSLHHICIYIYI